MNAKITGMPNPVLAPGSDDYNDNCSFDFYVDRDRIKVGPENILIPVSYKLECPSLDRLLKEGKAIVSVTAKSPLVSYLRLEQFGNGASEMMLKIPKYCVADYIELTCSINAATDIKKYDGMGDWNSLYFGSLFFNLQKGDVLAQSDRIVLKLKQNEYETSVGSIFQFVTAPDEEKDISVDFNQQRICIGLNAKMRTEYEKAKTAKNESFRKTCMALTLFPVLIEALSKLQASYIFENAEEYDYDWAHVIEQKLEDKGIAIDENLGLAWCANMLLGEAVEQAMNEINLFVERTNKEEANE